MALSTLEAYDLLRYADQLQARLAAAQAELSPKRALKPEKEWLAGAHALLAAAREPTAGLLERVRGLPELAEVRDEYAAEFQGQWVDALERLHAGITFHAGNRDPIIEALYPHQKFAALRRADKEGVREYARELDRRMRSAYVSRLLSQPAYAFAAPVLELVSQAFARWRSAYEGEGIGEEQAVELRKELVGAAKKLDLAVKQARLLAEAALAPVPGMFEELGLAARPKKRSKPSAKAREKAGGEQAAEGAGAAEASKASEAEAPAAEGAEARAAPAAAEAGACQKEEASAGPDEPGKEGKGEEGPAAQAVKPRRRRPQNGVQAEK